MSLLRRWISRLAGSFTSGREDQDLAAELEAHLQMDIDEQVRRGVPPGEARRRARIRSGGIEAAKEAVRDQRGVPFVDNLVRDVRYAVRGLARQPGFTIVAALTLAFGIGANSAIFSVFDQALRAPLPVHEPHRLVNLSSPGGKEGIPMSCNIGGPCEAVFSYPMYRDLEREQDALASIAAHRAEPATVVFQGAAVRTEVMLVSGSYFPTLDVGAALGRLIGPADDRVVGGHPVAVLGYSLWASHLGSDPSVIGRSLVLNGVPFEIIGVSAEGFRGTSFGSRPGVFVPITMTELAVPDRTGGFEDRLFPWVYVFGRLRVDGTREQAAAALTVPYRRILSDVEGPLQRGRSPEWMRTYLASEIVVEDGRRGQSALHRQAGIPLALVFLTTGAVLFVACANIASLLLARGAGRAHEMAVRISLGASRGRLVTQLLVESVVLAIVGGAAGLLVAHGSTIAVLSILPEEARGVITVGPRGSVLLFTAALSIGTGILFGIFPALQSTRRDLISRIRAHAPGSGLTRGAVRFRASLVGAQVAVSLAMLVGAGLFLRSLANVRAADLGIELEGIVTFAVAPDANRYDGELRELLFERIEQGLTALPGVTAVTSSSVPVAAGSSRGRSLLVESTEFGQVSATSSMNDIGAGFASLFGMELAAGREFTAADDDAGPRVAVVNEAFVARFGLESGAVGRRLGLDGPDGPLDTEIVGVVRNAVYSDVKAGHVPVFYLPWRQTDDVSALSLYVKSTRPADEVVAGIRNVVGEVDPALPVEGLRTMREQAGLTALADRMIGRLSAAFAILATALATLGLYGVMAFSVAARTREIGLRTALGASAGRVRRLIVAQASAPLAIGGTAGLLLAFGVAKASEAILYQVRALDPLSFAGGIVMLTLAALVSAWVPAHRAARVDPMVALRAE